MRLSQYQISQITNKILTDLYGTQEKTFPDRQNKIVKKNWELWMKPYMPIITNLPDNLIPTVSKIRLNIKYKIIEDDYDSYCEDFRYTGLTPESGLREIWHYAFKSPVIGPIAKDTDGGIKWHAPFTMELKPELYKETAELCEEMIALRTEKNGTLAFFDDTIHKYSGTLQLRKLWPESLHGYLPAEPAKKAPAKKVSITAPAHLNIRMATNLIEEN